MYITETDRVAFLQSLLDNTTERILLSIDQIKNKTFVLICKWRIFLFSLYHYLVNITFTIAQVSCS